MRQHRPLVERHRAEWLAFGAWIHPGGDLYLDLVTGRPSRREAMQEALRAGEREGRRVAATLQASTGQTLTLQPPL